MSEMILNLPREAPVMVLPNAVLIPNALLPLHIFEPQYRAMLAACLEGDRLFCVAMQRPGRDDSPGSDFVRVGGIGLVRACVGGEDGTANLILQGLARVKFGRLAQAEPFRVVEISKYPSDCPNLIEAEALATKVLEICARLQERGRELPEKLVERLREVNNPELLADIVAQTFLREPVQQQRMLEEASVSERLRLLIRYLGAEAAA